MDVVAVSTPPANTWRWRIVNYAGEVVEESRETFATIAAALASGAASLGIQYAAANVRMDTGRAFYHQSTCRRVVSQRIELSRIQLLVLVAAFAARRLGRVEAACGRPLEEAAALPFLGITDDLLD